MRAKFKPGDRVVFRSTDGETVREERGVVVWCWLNEQGVYDCYVAFFGADWPRPGEKPPKPYVLRYHDTSLEPDEET